MGRRIDLVLNLVIILSLAFAGTLSGILIPSPVATGTAHLPVVAPGARLPKWPRPGSSVRARTTALSRTASNSEN